ncbi:MAG: pilus assembly protein [Sphingobium sp.]|nr:pilus assembly protein [Sphingobium sp.]
MTPWRSIKLFAEERGAAVVELALVAPILGMAVIGIVDMSNAYSRKLALEQGAQRAIEKIAQTTEDATVETTLATEAVCQVNGVNPDGTCKNSPITTSNVTVTWRLECTNSSGTTAVQSSTDPATYDAFTCGLGTVSQARYVQVAVTDKYYPLFPLHFSAFTNADSAYHISATAGMRTS